MKCETSDVTASPRVSSAMVSPRTARSRRGFLLSGPNSALSSLHSETKHPEIRKLVPPDVETETTARNRPGSCSHLRLC